MQTLNDCTRHTYLLCYLWGTTCTAAFALRLQPNAMTSYWPLFAVVVLSAIACFALAFWIVDRKVTIPRLLAAVSPVLAGLLIARSGSVPAWEHSPFKGPVALVLGGLIVLFLWLEPRNFVTRGNSGQDKPGNSLAHLLRNVPRARLYVLVILGSALPAVMVWILRLFYGINRMNVPHKMVLIAGFTLIATWACNLVWLTGLALKGQQLPPNLAE